MYYKDKYLKYKKKYLELQKQLGGMNPSKEVPIGCIYNYNSEKCNQNENCVWDFTNLCVKKGEKISGDILYIFISLENLATLSTPKF